jgi:hypothetical protein
MVKQPLRWERRALERESEMYGYENEKAFAGIHSTDNGTNGSKKQEARKITSSVHHLGGLADTIGFDQIRPDQVPGF